MSPLSYAYSLVLRFKQGNDNACLTPLRDQPFVEEPRFDLSARRLIERRGAQRVDADQAPALFGFERSHHLARFCAEDPRFGRRVEFGSTDFADITAGGSRRLVDRVPPRELMKVRAFLDDLGAKFFRCLHGFDYDVRDGRLVEG